MDTTRYFDTPLGIAKRDSSGQEWLYDAEVGQWTLCRSNQHINGYDAQPISCEEAARECRKSREYFAQKRGERLNTRDAASYPCYYETETNLLIIFLDEMGNGIVCDGEKTWEWNDVPPQHRPAFGGFGAQLISPEEAGRVLDRMQAAVERRQRQTGGA